MLKLGREATTAIANERESRHSDRRWTVVIDNDERGSREAVVRAATKEDGWREGWGEAGTTPQIGPPLAPGDLT